MNYEPHRVKSSTDKLMTPQRISAQVRVVKPPCGTSEATRQSSTPRKEQEQTDDIYPSPHDEEPSTVCPLSLNSPKDHIDHKDPNMVCIMVCYSRVYYSMV